MNMVVLCPCIEYDIMHMLTCVEQMKTWRGGGGDSKRLRTSRSLAFPMGILG